MSYSTVGDLTLANFLTSASIWSTLICLHLITDQLSTLFYEKKRSWVMRLVVLNCDI